MGVNRKTYFIQEYLLEKVFNVCLGNVDLEKMLLQHGVAAIFFPCHFEFTLKAKIIRFCFLLKTLFTLPKGAVVFFQYPYYSGMTKLLLMLLHLFHKSVRLVCILTDINGYKLNQPQVLQYEIQLFRRFHYFIVHNSAMQQWLNEYVPGKPSVQLEFFDYLAPIPPVQAAQGNDIIFAGNLAESGFLEKLHEVTERCRNISFQVYGGPYPDKMQQSERVQYKGIFEPYQLPAHIKASYGLIWDGEEVDSVSGSTGPYMRYISHHKLSLYILCGLPILVWDQCGAASLIRQYNIGITIGNLFEIEEKIAAVSPSSYLEMQRNTRQLAEKIASGGCITAAYRQILAMIQKER